MKSSACRSRVRPRSSDRGKAAHKRVLIAHQPPDAFADQVAVARALLDPDSESLARCPADVESQSARRIAAE
jgi:hypothetical protein